MSLPICIPSLPLKVEDYCIEFPQNLTSLALDLAPALDQATDPDHVRRPSVSSVGTIPSPVSPTFPQSSQDESDDSWNLIPYNVPWGNNYHNYEYGTLPGPEGACIFLRSPTPVKNQRTSQACKKCRERKAKCSGTRPSCERCLARGHACVYVDDPKRVRRSTSTASLCHRSNHSQIRSVTRRTSSQSIMPESPLDDVHCYSPRSPIMSGLQLEPDSEPEFSTHVELNHEGTYDGEFSSGIQLSETPYALQQPPFDSSNPPPGSVHSPQPMRYPQLGSLLSISIPGTDEVPALESTSSSPASSSSQSTPLLDYQQGMFDQNFVGGDFGYDRSAHFQAYCDPRSVQYPQFDHNVMHAPMGCSFENSHQLYTIGGSGEHLLAPTEGLPHPYNEDLLVRPQFVPY